MLTYVNIISHVVGAKVPQYFSICGSISPGSGHVQRLVTSTAKLEIEQPDAPTPRNSRDSFNSLQSPETFIHASSEIRETTILTHSRAVSNSFNSPIQELHHVVTCVYPHSSDIVVYS